MHHYCSDQLLQNAVCDWQPDLFLKAGVNTHLTYNIPNLADNAICWLQKYVPKLEKSWTEKACTPLLLLSQKNSWLLNSSSLSQRKISKHKWPSRISPTRLVISSAIFSPLLHTCSDHKQSTHPLLHHDHGCHRSSQPWKEQTPRQCCTVFKSVYLPCTCLTFQLSWQDPPVTMTALE